MKKAEGMNQELPKFFIGGPYANGAYSVVETATSRVLRVFRDETDLVQAQAMKTVALGGLGPYRRIACVPDEADQAAQPGEPPRPLAVLARAILSNAAAFEWSLQGMGMLRLHLSNDCRLHVWDSRFRAPGVSMVHDHLQWGLHSTIVAGELRNVRYVEADDGEPFMARTLKPGYGYFWKDEAQPVKLRALPIDTYTAGAEYSQLPAEIHETDATDGTVTFMRKTPTDDESARVFWPAGTEWGSAEPRKATAEEVAEITGYALKRWFGGAAAPTQAAPPSAQPGEPQPESKSRGVFGKYILSKASGEQLDPEACYFILRLDTDEAAQLAAMEYARHCKNRELARDVAACVTELRAPCSCRSAADYCLRHPRFSAVWHAGELAAAPTRAAPLAGPPEPRLQQPLNPQPDGGYPGCDVCTCSPGYCHQNAPFHDPALRLRNALVAGDPEFNRDDVRVVLDELEKHRCASASPQAAAAQPVCVECEGPLQWRCPACRIAQSKAAAAQEREPTIRELHEQIAYLESVLRHRVLTDPTKSRLWRPGNVPADAPAEPPTGERL